MKLLLDIWEATPLGWRVGILVMLVVVFIIAPLDLLLKRVAPEIANAKFGPEFPVLSKNGRVLFNAILYSIMAIGGVVILLLTIGNVKTTTGARLGVSTVVFVFAILAITEFAQWRKAKTKEKSDFDGKEESLDDG